MTSAPPLAAADVFVDVPLRAPFFRSSAFFPMPIVLVSTRGPDGQTNLAPYSNCFPYLAGERQGLILVSAPDSKTAANIERTGRCSLNFIPDHAPYLANVKILGRPASTAEKMAQSVFTLVPSASRGGAPGGGESAPDRPCDALAEAAQVFECRWDRAYPHETAPDERQYLLIIERVRMKSRWARALEAGRGGPRLPIDYGFREATSSWMSRPRADVSGPRLRPRFEIVCPRPPQEVVELFREGLERPAVGVTGRIAGNHLQLDIPEAERRFWTPTLELHVDDHEEGSLIRGRVAPRPSVWQLFIGLHLLVAFCGLGAVMYGLSQWMTGESPWALWAMPIAIALHAFIAGGAFIGQGLGAEETHRLRSFMDDAVGG